MSIEKDSKEALSDEIKVKMIVEKIRTLFNSNSCDRVLLIAPPQVPEKDFDIDIALNKRYPACPPYGLGIINRKLIENGYTSDILDLNYEVLSFLNLNKKSFYYDIWKNKLRDKIDNFKPDVVGVTCMFTMTAPQMYEVTNFIKEVNKNIPIIVGGVHSSAAPRTVLEECKSIDLISLYEGDSSFIDLLNFIRRKDSVEKLKQIATIYGGQFILLDNHLREMDINTAPDYGGLHIYNYHFLGKIGAYHFLLSEDVRVSTILSNRGCRGKCVYCSVNAFYGRGVKLRDVIAVVDEMDYLKNKDNISHFMWLDDDLFYNEERATNLFNEIIQRQLNITWDASNGVIATSITSDLIDAAYKSGCIGLHLGIESGNPEILKSIRKPSTIEHFIKAAKILKNYPQIFTKGFLMVGFPGETIGQILDTVKLAKELQLDWYPIQILTVFPSTEIHKSLEKEKTNRKHITAKFFIGSTGGQRLREIQEKTKAKEFINLLETDQKLVPSTEQIKDIWFLVDYKVNYEKILSEYRPIKLRMLQKMLIDICNRVKENPMATLYLGIVEQKLGNQNKSQELKKLAQTYLGNSAYWQKRFEVLDLHKLLRRIIS